MDIILFFQSTNRKSWQRKLAGVYRFAREHDWFVQVVERKDLLLHTTYPIATVVALCGYESDAFAKKLFKRETGLTMRAWRKRNAKKSLLCVRRA